MLNVAGRSGHYHTSIVKLVTTYKIPISIHSNNVVDPLLASDLMSAMALGKKRLPISIHSNNAVGPLIASDLMSAMALGKKRLPTSLLIDFIIFC
jgi:hypothetical protein